jgi:hypothetical protein
MRRAVRKPKEMTVRKLVAIITKMIKSLARFPGASDDDKFEADDLLEIIEWALPVRWRAKFDLDRYVPSLFDKARLIAEAEAIERSEAVLVKPTKAQETKEKKTPKLEEKDNYSSSPINFLFQRTKAATRSASQADSYPPIVRPLSLTS